jgi:hypothetical protein
MRNGDLDSPDIWQARVDLAACFRAAARMGLHEGICNHLSFMVPGRDDLFPVNPDFAAISRATVQPFALRQFPLHQRVGRLGVVMRFEHRSNRRANCHRLCRIAQ